MTQSEGQVIGGQYQLGAEIASGGWSTVYEAMHLNLKRKVAIKILSKELLHRTNAAARFENEAKIVSNLSHANILNVIDFGTLDDGRPFMVMDFVDGNSLAQLIAKEGALGYRRCLPLFSQVAGALEYAHAEGVLHRDLKPSNVMIGRDAEGQEKAWLLDFGLAKILEEAHDNRLTRTGETVGTNFYMSPEQSRGEPLDGRSDIYSFGCLMYETLSGDKPFKGGNAVVLMDQHLTARPRKFSVAAPTMKIPRAVERLVMTAMAKAPGDRYQTAHALRVALEKTRARSTFGGWLQSELHYWLNGVGRLRRSRSGVAAILILAGLGAAGYVLVQYYHPSKGAATGAKSASVDEAGTVAGVWDSEWGPVHLFCSAAKSGHGLAVTGYWYENGRQAVVESGNYDPARRALHLKYHTPFNDQHGDAYFEMAPDGKILDGEWIQPTGRGTWTLRKRDAAINETGARSPNR